MKKFLMVLLLAVVAMLLVLVPMAMAEAVDSVPTQVIPAEVTEQPSVAAGVLLYTIISVVMWYVVDWFKDILLGQNIPEKVYKLIMLVVCLAVGMVLAFTFKVDAFILVGSLLAAVVPGTPAIEASTVGYIFGGLLFASGSAVVHEISKRLGLEKDNPTA